MVMGTNYRAPALEKGLDILELVARETEPLALAQISERLDRSKGEIFRMIQVLEDRGYIVRTPSGDRYSITNRLFMLGMYQPPVRNLTAIALPAMEGLADRSWQSSHLVVASDDEIVVIARVDSPSDIGYSVRIGHRRPITQSASGAVLFAFQPSELRERWLDRLRSGPTFDEAKFLSRVEKVRKQGYDKSKSTRVGSVTDLSAPIMKDGKRLTGKEIG
jgi:DNA-binding IclR family transcriptional regulator